MTRLAVIVCAVVNSLAGTASAAEQGQALRLIGEAPAATGFAPKRFFIDAVVTPGDEPFKSEVTGWLAALPPEVGSGEVTGSCVEKVCALSADLSEGKLALTGDLISPTPGPGKFQFGEDGTEKGEVRFTVAGMMAPDVGELAPADAITAAELADALAWNGFEGGFNNTDRSGAPTDFEREALANWQNSAGRPMTGLILVADLKTLRDSARDAKAKAGWTALGDAGHGWSGGYPATLLPVATRDGIEQRYASADGKAVLVIAIEPGRTSEAFDALVEQETADRAGVEDRGYTRVNGDMEMAYTEKGVRRAVAYHSREGGFARVVFTYPAGSEIYQPFETLLTRSLRVTDDLKAQ
jgi:hypothetical protein